MLKDETNANKNWLKYISFPSLSLKSIGPSSFKTNNLNPLLLKGYQYNPSVKIN